jgi:hypothetical protein
MKCVFGIAAAMLGFGGFCATPAIADPFWLYQGNAAEPFTRGQLYTGASVFGGLQQLPSVRSTISVFESFGGPFVSGSTFDRDPSGVQSGGMIGYMFAGGSLPTWVGQRVRLELSGNALFYSAKNSRSTYVPQGSGLTVAGIGGTTLSSGIATYRNWTLHEDYRVRREGFGLALTLASDHPMGPSLVLSPSISLFGGRTDDSYRIQSRFVIPFGDLPHQLNERLNTDEFGLKIGLTAQWQFAAGWSVNLAGRAGMVYLRSRLNGEDCLVTNPVRPGTDCGPSGSPLYYNSVVSTRDTAFGFRGGASGSISADLRYAIVTVGGSFRYDSHIPGVSNPQFRGQTFLNYHVAGGNSAARIKYSDGFAYGGFVRIAVPLNGFSL